MDRNKKLVDEVLRITLKNRGRSDNKMTKDAMGERYKELSDETTAILNEFGDFRHVCETMYYQLNEKGLEFIRKGGFSGEEKRNKFKHCKVLMAIGISLLMLITSIIAIYQK